YSREFSREYSFYAILQGIFHIATNTEFNSYQGYFEIPNNEKMFFDVIHRNRNKKDVAFQYVDKIIDNQLVSHLEKIEGEDLKNKKGLNEIVFLSKNI
ncbi:MAG: zinc carboxypeptidase, partial [Polaribacter sp.]|nr:zinc carboxypeptidase [Polaribacter sp.]